MSDQPAIRFCWIVLFITVSGAIVIVALDVALLGPRTTGRALEDVNGVPSEETEVPQARPRTVTT